MSDRSRNLSPWLAALVEGLGLLLLAGALFAAGIALVNAWRTPTPADRVAHETAARQRTVVPAMLAPSRHAPAPALSAASDATTGGRGPSTTAAP